MSTLIHFFNRSRWIVLVKNLKQKKSVVYELNSYNLFKPIFMFILRIILFRYRLFIFIKVHLAKRHNLSSIKTVQIFKDAETIFL